MRNAIFVLNGYTRDPVNPVNPKVKTYSDRINRSDKMFVLAYQHKEHGESPRELIGGIYYERVKCE